MEAFVEHYNSPLGTIEMVANNTALQSLSFFEKKTYPKKNNAVLENVLVQLDEYFNRKRIQFDFPLAPVGTKFQVRVWMELLKIPYAKTISYNSLAMQLGNQKVIRAAANANGKNPIAIVIPCHRVIGADGSLTGYAGGLWRKKWLLDFETGVLGLGI